MAFDLGASVGDLSSWSGGIPIPTPSIKVTDLSPQVDGGARARQGTSVNGRRMVGVGSGPHYDACILLLVIAAVLVAFHVSVRAHIL